MPESEPVQGLSLMASALWGQAKRNPAQAIALVFGFLLALRVLRRRSLAAVGAAGETLPDRARPRSPSMLPFSGSVAPRARGAQPGVAQPRLARVVGSSKEAAGSMATIPVGLIIGWVP